MKIAKTTALLVCLLALALSLAAAEEEPKYGSIEVLSEPAGASVYIEGFLAGETPVKVEQVVPGPYRLVVKKESFDDAIQDLQVVAGEIAKANIHLTAASGAWRSPVRAEDDWTPILDKDKKQYEKAKSKKRLRDYPVLEIANFLMKSDEEVPPDHLYALLRDLVKELDKRTDFDKFVTTYTVGSSPRWYQSSQDDDGPALVLSGVITRYQRGSRAKRYFVGFGAGKTRAYCLFRLQDKQTGEVVFERMENGSISGGLFGGGSAGAMKELAGDIAKQVDKNW